MSRERKFHNPHTTSVQLEKELFEISQDLDIKLTNALTFGLCTLIDWRIDELEDIRLTPELIQKYRVLKERYLKNLEEILKMRDLADKKVKDIQKASKFLEAKKVVDNEIIYVYDDIAEERIHIARRLFNPAVHKLIRYAPEGELEEAEG